MNTMEQVKKDAIKELLESHNEYELKEELAERSDGKKAYSLISADEIGEDVYDVDCGTLEEILDYLIKIDAKVVNGWIEITKAMPEQDENVLFIANGQIYLGYYYRIFDIDNSPINTFSANRGSDCFKLEDVKYWQPLPKMPN